MIREVSRIVWWECTECGHNKMTNEKCSAPLVSVLSYLLKGNKQKRECKCPKCGGKMTEKTFL